MLSLLRKVNYFTTCFFPSLIYTPLGSPSSLSPTFLPWRLYTAPSLVALFVSTDLIAVVSFGFGTYLYVCSFGGIKANKLK